MMKALVIAFVLFVSSVAQAQWKQDGKPVEDAPDRKSVGGFGGHLLVVRDPKAFFEEWQKPEMPKINTVTEVQRGELAAALVLFAGCKPDAQSMCNCEVDYFFYRADGSLYAERKGQPLWKEQAPPKANAQLGQAYLGIRMTDADPPGEYKIKAKVSDVNAAISFELETRIRLK